MQYLYALRVGRCDLNPALWGRFAAASHLLGSHQNDPFHFPDCRMKQPSTESAVDRHDTEDRGSIAGGLRSPRWLVVSQVGLFLIALGWVLYGARSILIPLVLAVLVSLVLRPVYAALRKLRLPRIVASMITVAGLVAVVVFASFQLIQPGAKWLETLDKEVVMKRVNDLVEPVSRVQSEIESVAEDVRDATTANDHPTSGRSQGPSGRDGEDRVGAIDEPIKRPTPSPVPVVEDESPVEERVKPVVVEIRESPFNSIVAYLQELGVATGLFFILVLFILAYGSRLAEPLRRDASTASIIERVEIDVSRYLFTITVINVCLGIAVAIATGLIGLPNPALWGVLAALLNFVPYVGGFVGAVAVFLAATATMESSSAIVAAPLAYLFLTTIEGNLITPMVLGGRFRLNPLVVFVWLLAWGAFWGVVGMLIATPALVTFKIVCEKTGTLGRFRQLLTS